MKDFGATIKGLNFLIELFFVELILISPNNEKRNGQGTYKWVNGQVFTGNWIDGRYKS